MSASNKTKIVGCVARSLAVSLVLAVVGLTACTNSLSGAQEKNIGDTGVCITIPKMSPFIEEMIANLSEDRGSDAERVFIAADSVKVSLLNVTDAVVATATSSDDVVSLNAAPGDYTVRVEVYNEENSSTIPVVAGEEAVTIVEGEVARVTVNCRPYNAATLDYRPQTVHLTPSEWEEYDNSYVYGQENWFSFTATSDTTWLRMIPADASKPGYVVTIYDDDSNIIQSYSPMYLRCQTEYLLFDTIVGESYHVGCIAVDSYYQGSKTNAAGDFSIALHRPLFSGAVCETDDVWLIPSLEEGLYLVYKEGLEEAELTVSYAEEGCTVSVNGVPASGYVLTIDLSNAANTIEISTVIDGFTYTEAWVLKTCAATVLNPSIGYTDIPVPIGGRDKAWVYVPVTAGTEYTVDEKLSDAFFATATLYDNGSEVDSMDMASWVFWKTSMSCTPTSSALLVSLDQMWWQNQFVVPLRVRPSDVNDSPYLEGVSGTLTVSYAQSTSSSVEEEYFAIIDEDGDTVTATAECTSAPLGVDVDDVDFDVSPSGSNLTLSFNRYAPAGEYTFTLTLNDGQGCNGENGVDGSSTVEIPITVTVEDRMPVAVLTSDVDGVAVGTLITMEGMISDDPDIQAASVEFSFTESPPDSQSKLSTPISTTNNGSIEWSSSFTPDVGGYYTVQMAYTHGSEDFTVIKRISVMGSGQGGINVSID